MPGKPLADRVWWTRFNRAAEAARRVPAGSKLMSDWARDVLEVLCDEELELVGPVGHRRWQPIPAERRTDEYRQRETRRLNSELGHRLGVGPMP